MDNQEGKEAFNPNITECTERREFTLYDTCMILKKSKEIADKDGIKLRKLALKIGLAEMKVIQYLRVATMLEAEPELAKLAKEYPPKLHFIHARLLHYKIFCYREYYDTYREKMDLAIKFLQGEPDYDVFDKYLEGITRQW